MVSFSAAEFGLAQQNGEPLTAETGREKRIFSTGCADENAKMTDCYFEKKDWRACAAEVRISFIISLS